MFINDYRDLTRFSDEEVEKMIRDEEVAVCGPYFHDNNKGYCEPLWNRRTAANGEDYRARDNSWDAQFD